MPGCWIGTDAVRQRRVGQDGQEPGRVGILLRKRQRAQLLPARHAGAFGGRLGAWEVPAVVGVPQQRIRVWSWFHDGVVSGYGLHVDDPRVRDVLAKPGHQSPVLGERGHLVAHVFTERPERRTVRAAQYDPAQSAKPVFVQRDLHRRLPGLRLCQ